MKPVHLDTQIRFLSRLFPHVEAHASADVGAAGGAAHAEGYLEADGGEFRRGSVALLLVVLVLDVVAAEEGGGVVVG